MQTWEQLSKTSNIGLHEPFLTKFCYKKLFVSVFLLTAAVISYSQNPLFLPLTKIETKDGLSSPNVRKILQDNFGFMWFATQDGLNRFDGNKMIQYNGLLTDYGHSILGSDVYDLIAEQNSYFIWCLTAYGGLNKIDTRTGAVCNRESLLHNPANKGKVWFKCMAIRTDDILIGTAEGLLIKYSIANKKTSIIHELQNKLSVNASIDKVFVDKYGDIWLMLGKYGFFVIDGHTLELKKSYTWDDFGYRANENCQFTNLVSLDNTLLVSSTFGLSQINLSNGQVQKKRNVILAQYGNLYNSPIYSMSKMGDTILFANAEGLQMLDINNDIFKKIVVSRFYDDKSWLQNINFIFQGGSNIWIGSSYGVGWIKNSKLPFVGFYTSMNGNYTKIQHSVALCKVRDSVLAVCADDGLYWVNYFNGDIIKSKQEDFFYYAFKISSKYILASGLKTGMHLFDISGTEISINRVCPELSAIRQDVLVSSQQLGDSIYFMASQNEKGIYIWNRFKRELRLLNTNTKPIGLNSNVINRLFLDSKSHLWIVGDNSVSIYDYKKNTIEHLNLRSPISNEPLSINMDMCETKNSFWLAVYGKGIIKLDSNKKVVKIYGVQNRIKNVGLYKIFPVNDSTIIASSNNGLIFLNFLSEKVVSFFESDGIQSDNFEEMSGCEDGRFIFLGGLKGFTMIEKAKLNADYKHKSFYFSSVQINRIGQTLDISDFASKEVVIPNDATQVIVNFSYLDYTNPVRNLFRYRLKGINEKWDTLMDIRAVPLVGVPTGRYTLELETISDVGVWSEPVILSLYFLPKWYQTWWFRIGVGLVVLGLLYLLYRYRIAQIKKQHEIRKSIATDLHDDLGSTLNSVKIFTNLAISGVKQQESLQQVKNNLNEATMGLRDMIWVLDDSLDTVDELVSRLKLFAIPMAGASGMELDIKAESEANSRKLTKEEKRNLFLICKEAINNSVKYSQASKIEVGIKAMNKKIQITIGDNGNGFDSENGKKGYGLKNMQYRAGQIKYRVVLESTQGMGTHINIMPL